MEGWADRRMSMVGGGGGGREGPCPPRNWKNMLSGKILTSFTYVLLMKLGKIDKHCIHAKNGKVWADRCLSMMGGDGGLAPPP